MAQGDQLASVMGDFQPGLKIHSEAATRGAWSDRWAGLAGEDRGSGVSLDVSVLWAELHRLGVWRWEVKDWEWWVRRGWLKTLSARV